MTEPPDLTTWEHRQEEKHSCEIARAMVAPEVTDFA